MSKLLLYGSTGLLRLVFAIVIIIFMEGNAIKDILHTHCVGITVPERSVEVEGGLLRCGARTDIFSWSLLLRRLLLKKLVFRCHNLITKSASFFFFCLTDCPHTPPPFGSQVLNTQVQCLCGNFLLLLKMSQTKLRKLRGGNNVINVLAFVASANEV